MRRVSGGGEETGELHSQVMTLDKQETPATVTAEIVNSRAVVT